MFGVLLVVYVLSSCFLSGTWSVEAGAAEKLCKAEKATGIDENLMKEGFANGIYVVMTKKNEISPEMLTKESPPDKRKWAKKACFSAKLRTDLGSIKGEGACKYNTSSLMSCTGFGSFGVGDMKSKWN